jgi:hypothetical protein
MAILVNSISHASFMTGKSAEITIGGTGFVAPIAVIINMVRIPCHYANSFMAKFVLPYIPAGIYDITVVNGDQSSYVFRQQLTITDPDPSLNIPALGSAGRPIVIPSTVIQGIGTASVSTGSKIRKYETPASVSVDDLGNATAIKSSDPSVVTDEGVTAQDNQRTNYTGIVLQTPFGNFGN